MSCRALILQLASRYQNLPEFRSRNTGRQGSLNSSTLHILTPGSPFTVYKYLSPPHSGQISSLNPHHLWHLVARYRNKSFSKSLLHIRILCALHSPTSRFLSLAPQQLVCSSPQSITHYLRPYLSRHSPCHLSKMTFYNSLSKWLLKVESTFSSEDPEEATNFTLQDRFDSWDPNSSRMLGIVYMVCSVITLHSLSFVPNKT